MNKWVKLGDLIQSVSKTHKFNKKELVFLNTSDVLEGKILVNSYMPVSKMKGQAKKTIQNGDILYSEIRPKNKRYAYVKNLDKVDDYVVSTKLMVLRNQSDKLDTDYLYHFLTSEEAINYLQNRAENRIGSFPQITFEIVKSLNIWLPNLSTQQKIASVLSALDDKIELNNQINDNLEQMAKALYDYWFVQFDFPDEQGKPYKSSGGKMMYNEVLKREIPEGWQVKRFGECFNISRGTLITKETSTVGNYKVVAAGLNYSYLTGTFNREKFTITVSGSGANAGFINFWTEPIFASDCTTVRGRCQYETFFGLQFLKSHQAYIYTLAKGSAQPHVYPSDVEGLNVILPNEKWIKTYGDVCLNIYNKIENNLKQNQELAQLRDWLLPMLMNGQVKVQDLEENVLVMVAEPKVDYIKKEDRFQLWLSNEKLAARGDIDEVVLREIFDAMDHEDQ